VIRVDAWWLAVQPLDMRVGTEAALARVVQVFGQAHPHHAYLFANRRANRMKVLVHDGIGVWLAARRLNIGKFTWSKRCGEHAAAVARAVRRPGAGPAVAAGWRGRHHPRDLTDLAARRLQLPDVPMRLGTGAARWLSMISAQQLDALDPQMRQAMLSLMAEMQAQQGQGR
jgi:transposase